MAAAKPRVNVCAIGHDEHGKTTLTAAIKQVLAEAQGNGTRVVRSGQSLDDLDRASVTASGETLVEYETGARRYAHIEFSGHAACVTAMVTGAAQMDGGILVVSATDGPMQQTRELIMLARQVGVPALVVFISKMDEVEDEELADHVEMDVRGLLSLHKFPGDSIPVIRGSAVCALSGERPEIGRDAILRLLAAADESIPLAPRALDMPFAMPVDGVSSADGGGALVAGRVLRGVLKAGEEVEIVGMKEGAARATVTGVELFRKARPQCMQGDNAKLVLQGVDPEGVQRGQVLCKPGSIKAYRKFEGVVYVLRKEEGGRLSAFTTGHKPQLFFNGVDVTGTVTLPDETPMVTPGNWCSGNFELLVPVAMEPRKRFAIREGGRTVAAGVVSEVLR